MTFSSKLGIQIRSLYSYHINYGYFINLKNVLKKNLKDKKTKTYPNNR